jgi:hypothetical protein
MPDKPPEPEDDKEAERRFNETLGRLVNTPHKPHVKKLETDSGRTGEKRTAPKSGPKSHG